jgi:CelD/BcsL family acetyltransferase involved in cellulose biosynthesis
MADSWRDRAAAAGNAFLTPEWLSSYLAAVPDAQPFVIAAADSVLPLVRRGSDLRFPASSLGDQFGLLGAADDGPVLDATCRELVAAASDWRVATLDRVDAAWAGELAQSLRRAGARLVVTDTARLPTVDLAGLSWEDYLGGRSRNFRADLKRKERALEREHRVEFVEIRDPDAVTAALETHFELHELRWPTPSRHARRGETIRAFHRAFAGRAAERGWLRLWQLRADGRPIATWYGWNLGGRYSYYQAGLDPSWARFSPGTLLLARTIRAAVEEGCSAYEFLLGDERYKQRFSVASHEVVSLTVTRGPSVHLAVAAGVSGARRQVRRLPPPLRRTLRRAKRTLW